MADKGLGPLTFGFDIGIASVGWCVLGENRIVDLGVRCFDKAETAKEGESLNLARRTARLMRRRLRRRAWRLTKLARLLKRNGLIADVCQLHQPAQASPWQLRVEGLDRCLTDEEWARVIFHLCKHRGFHWISRAEEKKAEGDKKEGGKVKQGLDNTAKRMAKYRSAAEMVLAEFPDAQRNKQGDYGKALSRTLLCGELTLLFERQREFGNPRAETEMETAILGNGDRKSGLFWEQKPPLAGADLLKMLGKCTFEREEYRAPKASFTAERHVWLTRLNNLRIVVDGTTRPLNPEERLTALPLPYGYADAKLSYKQLRTVLTKKAGLNNFNFAGISEDKEKDTLTKLPAWETLSKKLKERGLGTEWESMAGAATGGNPTLLDEIARVLSVFKDGTEVEAELHKLSLPGGEKMIEALAEISFDKFHALSLKALRKIVPHMETGLRYDEACKTAGYHHSQLNKPDDEKELYLPPLYEHARGKGPGQEGKMVFSERLEREITGGIPRNPVVLRALNQARKVLNTLVRTYGSPVAVHIEMARDLSRPLKERKAVKDAQEEYRERNEKDKVLFVEQFEREPKRDELEKFQLYREQHGKSMYPALSDDQGICAYSFAPIDLSRLLEAGYVEIDHALPYRRSYDNSKNNKVLVLTKENRDKGNRTPYEYLGGAYDSPRWVQFVAFVESNHYRTAKKGRLLRKNFGEEEAREFRERNLNDTRYICRFFKNYVERYLQFAQKVGADGTVDQTAKRCVVVSGGLTSLLRARWGLPTSKEKREESDRHHAMDAAVVVACGHLVVQRTSTMLNTEDWAHRPDLGGYLNTETGEILTTQEFVHKDEVYKLLPRPWKHFRDELLARLAVDDATELRAKIEALGTYPPQALDTLHPLFVSRATQRRSGGAAHKETIYSQPEQLRPTGQVVQHIDLESLTRKHFGFLEDYFAEKKRLAAGTLTRKTAAELFKSFADPKSETWSTEKKWRECKIIDPLRNKEFYEALYNQLVKHEWNGKKAFADRYNKPTRRKNAATSPPVRKIAVIDTLSGIQVRGGIAKNDSLLRLDVFSKANKFYLIPVYAHHRVATTLPTFTADGETEIDDSFQFQFSIHPCDLIRVTLNGGELITGYFKGYGGPPNPSNITLQVHDRNRNGHRRANDKGEIPSIGVKTAVALEKFHVDVLGNIYPAPQEQRRGLA